MINKEELFKNLAEDFKVAVEKYRKARYEQDMNIPHFSSNDEEAEERYYIAEEKKKKYYKHIKRFCKYNKRRILAKYNKS